MFGLRFKLLICLGSLLLILITVTLLANHVLGSYSDRIQSLNRVRRFPFRCEKRRGRKVTPLRIGPPKGAPVSTVTLRQAQGERSI